MKLSKKNKIIAAIIGSLVAVTAVLSLAFSVYPYFFLNHAPELLINILSVINFVLPLTGICVMLAFIYRRERS